MLVFLTFASSIGPVLPSLFPLRFFGALTSRAATLTWDGGAGDGLWSTPANWSEDRLPAESDTVVFNATSRDDVIINQPTSVGGIDITLGYTGTIRSLDEASLAIGQGGFRQAGGTFIGGNHDLVVNGSVILLGGQFLSTSGTLSVKGNFFVTGNVFQHGGGTVVFDGIEQTLFGEVAFNNLVKEALVGQTFIIGAESRIAAQGRLQLSGTAEGLLRLRSSLEGFLAHFVPSSTVSLAHVDAHDVAFEGERRVSCTPGCRDGGNIQGLDFVEPAPPPTFTERVGEQFATITDLSEFLTGNRSVQGLKKVSVGSEELIAAHRVDFQADEPVEFTLKVSLPNTADVSPTSSPTLTPSPGVDEALTPLLTPSAAPSATPNALQPTPSPTPSPDGISAIFTRFIPTASAQEPTPPTENPGPTVLPEDIVPVETVSAEIRDPSGEPVDLELELTQEAGAVHLSFSPPERSLHPGKYTLALTAVKDNEALTAEQDFTWGVLAVNLDRSSYTPQQPVVVGMAVLDDQGHTLCDAHVDVTVTNPLGATAQFSTTDGSVSVAPTCADQSVTDDPDYRLELTPGQVGDYSLTVTAQTANGSRQASQSFEVTAEPTIVVSRQSATRIFPLSPYTVRLFVTAPEDINGTLTETIPASFAVTDNSSGAEVTPEGDTATTLTWPITLTAGQETEVWYTYDAPDISPEFYTLGPASIKGDAPAGSPNLFTEPRSWQIAADQIGDGINAVDVLGHYDENVTAPGPIYTKIDINDGSNKFGFSTPQGNAVFDTTGHRMFFADTVNRRILVYNLNTDNTLLDRIPDNVLGQPNFYTNWPGVVTQAGFNNVVGMVYDSARNYLFAVIAGQNRILVYDVASITNGENAINVLGQALFTTSTAANSQTGLNVPINVAYDSTRQYLFVSSRTNNSVRVFDVSTITDGENAINVLGQSTFTGATAATTQVGLNFPEGLAYEDDRDFIYVAQNTANRVTVFDVSTITDGENAINVLGQADFITATAADSQTGLRAPRFVEYDSIRNYLFIAEATGNRVKVFDLTTITDGENAINVLGQALFTTSTAATTQTGLNVPFNISYESGTKYLYVPQTTPHRVSIFDLTTITDGENAIDLLGQYDENTTAPAPIYTKRFANNGPNQFGFSNPRQVEIDTTNHRLFVTDFTNGRALVYNLNTDNTLLDRLPDNVLGVSNFYAEGGGATQTSLNQPTGLVYDAARNYLFVADSAVRRITVYDVASITNGENAINVLGQATFTASAAANSQTGLNAPDRMTYDTVRKYLFVAEANGNRVKVFDVDTITDGENAINVLGQADFISFGAAVTQVGMSDPHDVAYDAARNYIYVSENAANRVTVFDVGTITNGENAINVLGQADFISSAAANTQTGLKLGRGGVVYDATRKYLFVGEESGYRVKVFDLNTITDGENAINVLGQADFTSTTATNTQTSINAPTGMTYDSGNEYLYVTEADTDRISIFNVSNAASTFTQNDWRWYVDSDNENVTDPWGNPNIAENTAITVTPATLAPPASATELRLRINITVATAALSANTQAFSLEYVAANTCSSASGWAAVGATGSGTIWRFASSNVTDQTTLSAVKLSTSEVRAAYAKSNDTVANPLTVTAGQDMEWDFHIENNGATSATKYCFRVVKSDDSVISYNSDSYPQVTTKPATDNLMRHGNVFVGGIEQGFTWAD